MCFLKVVSSSHITDSLSLQGCKFCVIPSSGLKQTFSLVGYFYLQYSNVGLSNIPLHKEMITQQRLNVRKGVQINRMGKTVQILNFFLLDAFFYIHHYPHSLLLPSKSLFHTPAFFILMQIAQSIENMRYFAF